MPGIDIRPAAPVVRGCRMIKSAHELALMQIASDITIAAYRHTHRRIERGMTPGQIGAIMNGATEALGGSPEFALILLGEASAYPHGSGQPQHVQGGEVVLMDCGCTVEGYQSDISRTFVFGEASREQRRVWDQVHQGQQIANDATRIGRPAGSVDDAVRAQYERWGYGPGYRLPGLSHRTGHGIGLDGHEPVNLVHGETTALAPGMCFSNEPGLYIPGQLRHPARGLLPHDRGGAALVHHAAALARRPLRLERKMRWSTKPFSPGVSISCSRRSAPCSRYSASSSPG